MLLTDTLRDAFEILLPRCCLVCDRPLLRQPLCWRCIPQAEPRFFTFENWPELPFRSLYSLWSYHGAARRFITTMKYRPSLTLAKIAGEQFSQEVKALPQLRECDLIVPIPSSQGSFRKRLFNQALVLGRGCAQRSALCCHHDALQHAGYSTPQASLSTRDRYTNVRNTFRANPRRVGGRTILLIDDVATTGATLASASKALLAAGALQVHTATLAHSEGLQSSWEMLQQEFS